MPPWLISGRGTPATGSVPTAIDTLIHIYIKKINPIEVAANLENSVEELRAIINTL